MKMKTNNNNVSAADILAALNTYFTSKKGVNISDPYPDNFVRATEIQLTNSFMMPYIERRADFMALERKSAQLRPLLHMVEIKVSRSDWLREMRDPDKAQAFLDAGVDYVWLATPDLDIARNYEVPLEWGWLYWRGGKLRAHHLPKGYAKPKHEDIHHVTGVCHYGLDVKQWRTQAAADASPWSRELTAGFIQATTRTKTA